MNHDERGECIHRVINQAFPTLPPAGCVGTAMAFDAVAAWARAQLERLPELTGISTGMKHHVGKAVLADVMFASRPTADPLEVVFGLPGARVGTGEYVQPFVTASTDGRPATYYDGLPPHLAETDTLKHIARFADRYRPDYGFYRTTGGKPRVAEHHPSSSDIDDAEVRKRYESARAKALAPRPAALVELT